jgi:hypothetical protein
MSGPTTSFECCGKAECGRIKIGDLWACRSDACGRFDGVVDASFANVADTAFGDTLPTAQELEAIWQGTRGVQEGRSEPTASLLIGAANLLEAWAQSGMTAYFDEAKTEPTPNRFTALRIASKLRTAAFRATPAQVDASHDMGCTLDGGKCGCTKAEVNRCAHKLLPDELRGIVLARAYVGALDDLEIWKKRALKAEESCRRLKSDRSATRGGLRAFVSDLWRAITDRPPGDGIEPSAPSEHESIKK